MFGLFGKKNLTRSMPSEAIDEIINKYVTPQLKSEGFKKLGRTWRKEFADYTFIINVQANKWNGRGVSASFVINYGIYIPSIYEPLFSMQSPKSPKEYDCLIRKRLVDDKRDEIWWNVYDYTDTAQLGRELSTEIFEQCIGFFGQFYSLADMASLLQKGNLLACALLYVKLGEREKAKDYFISAYHNSSENEHFQSKVLSVAKSCGFNL